MTDAAISVQSVTKAYRIWRDPAARLKMPLWNAVKGAIPRAVRPRALRERIGSAGANRYYKDFFALRNVSFEVSRGSAVGIVGRNGSGKSTLLQVICGTLTPTSGSVTARGRIAALLELGSGFNPEFTGLENVFLNGAVLGLSRERVESRLDEILAFADIGPFAEQPVKTYSSGMRMRLAFAVQVAVEPEVLIVDEALGVGDEAFQQKCFARLRKLRDAGTTLLFVSHDAGTVLSLCDRAVLLDQGSLVSEGAPKEVIARYHALLYAPGGAALEPASPQASLEHPGATSGGELPDPLQKGPTDESFFDHSLAVRDPVCYAHRGVRITGFSLLNEKGARVNVLSHGCRYTVTVQAACEQSSAGVFFGSMISTLKGMPLSGFNTPHMRRPIPVLEAGQSVVWSYTFTCMLLESTYVVELGVGGLVGDNPFAFLHRIEDALLFRVLPMPALPNSALVSLQQHGAWSVVTMPPE
jgi:lipopolysaccharide transport system ATP-binding protein